MLNIEKYRDKILKRISHGHGICDAAVKFRCDESCEDLDFDYCKKCIIDTVNWLCEEYKEPEVDWNKVERGTIVIVWDFNEKISSSIRKFFDYDPSLIEPFITYNQDGTGLCSWKHCRLAEDVEE